MCKKIGQTKTFMGCIKSNRSFIVLLVLYKIITAILKYKQQIKVITILTHRCIYENINVLLNNHSSPSLKCFRKVLISL